MTSWENSVTVLFLLMCLVAYFPRTSTSENCCSLWLLFGVFSTVVFIGASVLYKTTVFLPSIALGILVAYQQYELLKNCRKE